MIMIIMSRCLHRFPCFPPATRLYRPSLLADPLDYLIYRHTAVLYRFWLVFQPLFVHVKGFNKSPSIICLSLLPQQCPTGRIRSTRIVFVVVVQLLFCRVLPPGLIQYISQHYCVFAVKLFLHTFS